MILMGISRIIKDYMEPLICSFNVENCILRNWKVSS
nr:hypothetical protein CJLB15_00062 [Campylobacter phage CJLB-15]